MISNEYAVEQLERLRVMPYFDRIDERGLEEYIAVAQTASSEEVLQFAITDLIQGVGEKPTVATVRDHIRIRNQQSMEALAEYHEKAKRKEWERDARGGCRKCDGYGHTGIPPNAILCDCHNGRWLISSGYAEAWLKLVNDCQMPSIEKLRTA